MHFLYGSNPIILWVSIKKKIGLKTIVVQNNFGSNQNLVKNNFGSKIDFKSEKINCPKNFGSKKFCVKMLAGQMFGQISPWQLASVRDGPRNLPVKFGQNRVSNSGDITDMDKCC